MTSVLDATAGGRHMWHDEMKDADRVVYADRRRVQKGELEHQPGWSCAPDVLADARNLPFASSSFDLIAFDPPHRVTDGGMKRLSGVIEQKYGALRAETWQSDLREAFGELWRVLRPGGTLTLKWADNHKSHDAVLACLSESPLYGVTTQKDDAVVKWWVFHKPRASEQATTRDKVAVADGGNSRMTGADIDRTEEGE
jgi:SAM-dependent methyltransferase